MGGSLAGADLGRRRRRGLGYLLAQHFLAAGEQVLDVWPKLGARVRLLAAGTVGKNNPDDARSVAVAALRSPASREVRPGDHAAVLKMWSKRHRDLDRTRTQVACRLHAVLCELIPGGVSKEITAGHAAHVLESVTPSGAVEAARCELAAAFPGDLRRVDAQLLDARKKLTVAVRAPGTTLTQIFGAGPVVAATVIGCVRDGSTARTTSRGGSWPARDTTSARSRSAMAGSSPKTSASGWTLAPGWSPSAACRQQPATGPTSPRSVVSPGRPGRSCSSDGSQMVGALPVAHDLRHVDVLVTADHKFLLNAGRGMGYCYLSPTMQERFTPINAGWRAGTVPLGVSSAPR
jgi:hypothetical protein